MGTGDGLVIQPSFNKVRLLFTIGLKWAPFDRTMLMQGSLLVFA